MLSFHVTRRTHELGVRMALGAPRRLVLGLMLAWAARLVLVGLGVGVVASLAATRLLRSQLFGVQPADPLPYVVVDRACSARSRSLALLPAGAPRRRPSIRWWRSGRTERYWHSGCRHPHRSSVTSPAFWQ